MFLRKLAEQVFAVFAADLTRDALQTMLDVLEQTEGLSGQNALFQQGGQASEPEDLEDDDVEVMDVEEPAPEASNDEIDVEDASISPTSDDSDSDASDSGSSEVARFDKALASTLKTSKPDTMSKDGQAGDHDGNVSDSSVSDTSMTDSQMLALEPHLTAIFKEQVAAGQINSLQDEHKRKKSKKQGSEHKRAAAQARETIINFKNRVLDLLDLWLKQHPSMPLTLDVIPSFLSLIRNTRNKQIADKTIGTLRTFYDSAKRKGLPLIAAGSLSSISNPTASGEEAQTLLGLMESIHSEALKFAS